MRGSIINSAEIQQICRKNGIKSRLSNPGEPTEPFRIKNQGMQRWTMAKVASLFWNVPRIGRDEHKDIYTLDSGLELKKCWNHLFTGLQQTKFRCHIFFLSVVGCISLRTKLKFMIPSLIHEVKQQHILDMISMRDVSVLKTIPLTRAIRAITEKICTAQLQFRSFVISIQMKVDGWRRILSSREQAICRAMQTWNMIR